MTTTTTTQQPCMYGGTLVMGGPNDIDVVFGRGGFSNRHPGNQNYLTLIRKHVKAYMACQRKYQKLISVCIIHQLRLQGTRFLKRNGKSGEWTTVKLSECRTKVSQRLREEAPYIKLEQKVLTTSMNMANNKPSYPYLSLPKMTLATVTQQAFLISEDERSTSTSGEDSLAPLWCEDHDYLSFTDIQGAFASDDVNHEATGSKRMACSIEGDFSNPTKRRKISIDYQAEELASCQYPEVAACHDFDTLELDELDRLLEDMSNFSDD